jgi:hypothetical protein
MRSLVLFALFLTISAGCASDHVSNRAYIISQSQKKEQPVEILEEEDGS